MSTLEIGVSINDKSLLSDETKEVPAKPLNTKDSSRERSIEDFLKNPNNKFEENQSGNLQNDIPIQDDKVNNKVVTPLINAEITDKIQDDKRSINSDKKSSIHSDIKSLIHSDNESVVSLSVKSISSHHTGKSIPDIERDNTPVMDDYDNNPVFVNSMEMEREKQVATPTIKTRQREPSKSQKRAKEFQSFVEKLNELSETLQRKDDEIKRLSQKLLELECKETNSKSKPKRKSSSTSSSSSSSSKSGKKKGDQETDNSKSKVMEKEKKKDKGKKEETVLENDKEKKKDKENKEEKDVGKDKKKKDKNNKEEKAVEKGESKDKEKVMDKKPEHKNEKEDIKYNVQQCDTKEKQELSVLNIKLSCLEEEVRRLQQTNVEAILAATSRHHDVEANDRLTNEIVTKQLLAEHNLLKEKIEQLRSEQKALAQYVPLEDDIKQLKDDVHMLRNQNELLQRFVKSSSTNALNNSPKSHDKKEPFKEKLKVSKKPVDCQKPLSGDKRSFRTRKLSDSSSVLMEDVTPKVWTEPMYDHSTDYYTRRYTSVDRDNVDSSSGTEDWGRPLYSLGNRYKNNNDFDLLSTTDSDTIVDSSDRDQYQRRPIYSCPFTPKSPTDLSLEDLVKFERPNGKMSVGRICFVGHLAGRRELCVGLELDEDSGNHDGVFEGKRYFQCKRNRGVFVSFHKIVLAYKSL